MTASPPFPSPPADRMTHAPRRSLRGAEMAVTCAVHALAVAAAALAFDWQSAGEDGHTATPHLVLIAPHQQDHPATRPKAHPAPARPKPAPPAPGLMPMKPAEPMPVARQAEEISPTPAPAQESAPPAQEAQSYRRAIMARLEAQRSYPGGALRRNWQGSGAVLFRIERSGRLLEAALTASTGHAALDKAALGIVRRAAPFPAIPDTLPDELAITMPVAFLIDHPTGARP